MSWSDDKELSSGADAIGWNSLKKKNSIHISGILQKTKWELKDEIQKKIKTIETKIKTCQT